MHFPLQEVAPPPAQLRADALALPTPPPGGSDWLVMGEGCFRPGGIKVDEPGFHSARREWSGCYLIIAPGLGNTR